MKNVTIVTSAEVHSAAYRIGNGNASLGYRLAVEAYEATAPVTDSAYESSLKHIESLNRESELAKQLYIKSNLDYSPGRNISIEAASSVAAKAAKALATARLKHNVSFHASSEAIDLVFPNHPIIPTQTLYGEDTELTLDTLPVSSAESAGNRAYEHCIDSGGTQTEALQARLDAIVYAKNLENLGE